MAEMPKAQLYLVKLDLAALRQLFGELLTLRLSPAVNGIFAELACPFLREAAALVSGRNLLL